MYQLLLPYEFASAALSFWICLSQHLTGSRLVMMLILWFLVFLVVSAILVLLLMCLSAIPVDRNTEPDKPTPYYRWLCCYIQGLILAVCRINLHVSGLEKIPKGRFLLVGNHRSNLDPIAAAWAFKNTELAFVSKPENLKIPAVGTIVHRNCYMPIDRTNERNALKTILRAADYLKNDAVSVGIYPEGTRSKGKNMLPFRQGAFKIAKKAKVPVVVLHTSGTELVHERVPLRKTNVNLKILKVYSAEEVSEMSTAELSERTYAILDAENQKS